MPRSVLANLDGQAQRPVMLGGCFGGTPSGNDAINGVVLHAERVTAHCSLLKDPARPGK